MKTDSGHWATKQENGSYHAIRLLLLLYRFGGKWLIMVSLAPVLAYFFVKELYAKYKIPMGMINASYGGTPIHAWISEEDLKPFPDSYKEIADLMKISPRTVDSYRENLFLKLEIKSRVGLALFAVKNGAQLEGATLYTTLSPCLSEHCACACGTGC